MIDLKSAEKLFTCMKFCESKKYRVIFSLKEMILYYGDQLKCFDDPMLFICFVEGMQAGEGK